MCVGIYFFQAKTVYNKQRADPSHTFHTGDFAIRQKTPAIEETSIRRPSSSTANNIIASHAYDADGVSYYLMAYIILLYERSGA